VPQILQHTDDELYAMQALAEMQAAKAAEQTSGKGRALSHSGPVTSEDGNERPSKLRAVSSAGAIMPAAVPAREAAEVAKPSEAGKPASTSAAQGSFTKVPSSPNASANSRALAAPAHKVIPAPVAPPVREAEMPPREKTTPATPQAARQRTHNSRGSAAASAVLELQQAATAPQVPAQQEAEAAVSDAERVAKLEELPLESLLAALGPRLSFELDNVDSNVWQHDPAEAGKHLFQVSRSPLVSACCMHHLLPFLGGIVRRALCKDFIAFALLLHNLTQACQRHEALFASVFGCVSGQIALGKKEPLY
jgi:hypothetical protein